MNDPTTIYWKSKAVRICMWSLLMYHRGARLRLPQVFRNTGDDLGLIVAYPAT